jgi:MOSC domain-containing protein YiiM
MGTPAETCADCGFDGGQYNLSDVLGTLRAFGSMWRWSAEGVGDDILRGRPAPDVWSAGEYADHSADIVRLDGLALAILLSGEDIVIGADAVEVPSPTVAVGFDEAVGRLENALADLHDLVGGVAARDSAWGHTITSGGEPADAHWLLRHIVHDVSHHLMDVGRGLHGLGAGPSRQVGTVAQLHLSDGGVPKLPVDAVDVGPRGVVGDRQANRKHHGRPLQALCLWSTEVIDALRAEGHPIAPGLAGENITVSGIDWAGLRPGVQLRIGTVLAEISAWATPCKKNAAWFGDRDFNRMHHDRHPGTSRAYAWVRQPGRIETGDEVIVEP